MIIKSLEEMEKIVRNNKNLSWDGWDVVSLKWNPGAYTKPNGAYVRGKWYTKFVYPVTETGWNIPDKIVG
jgi:hypothetical protein